MIFMRKRICQQLQHNRFVPTSPLGQLINLLFLLFISQWPSPFHYKAFF